MKNLNLLNSDKNFVIGNKIIKLDVIDSTNNYSKKNINDLKEGTIVIANHQTMGRGRISREWEDEKNKNILLSIILKPKIMIDDIGTINLLIAASIYETLKEYHDNIKIKWPNDLFLNSKKFCGILIETKIRKNNLDYMIIGIGINLNSEKFSKDLKNKATSLKLETGYEIDKNIVLEKLLKKLNEFYLDFLKGKREIIYKICREHSYILGKKVKVIINGIEKKVKVIDVNSTGELIVEYNDNIEILAINEVTLCL